jgi:hypothetical protein
MCFKEEKIMPKKTTPANKDTLQTTIYLPVRLGAWLGYQATLEGVSRNDIILRLVQEYHAKCTKKDATTPAIE